ncbi:LPXTG cell wall anchor domain-containing protein [Lentibacillus kimchii]|uniref:LPXTG cell wall anchor domain-containing protein n=1 Tax=Lentibacillus kimchii TaxID=1542911 RepID=A0ABW2UYC3_9BACI
MNAQNSTNTPLFIVIGIGIIAAVLIFFFIRRRKQNS